MKNSRATLIRLQKSDGTHVFISHLQSGPFFPKEEVIENTSLETYQLSGIILPPVVYPLVMAHFLLARTYQNLRAAWHNRQLPVNVPESDVEAQFEAFRDTLEEILETFYFNLNPQQGQEMLPFIDLQGNLSVWVPEVGKTSPFIAKFQQIFPKNGMDTDTVTVSEGLADLFHRLSQTFHLSADMEKWDELSQLNFMELEHIQAIHNYFRHCLAAGTDVHTINTLTDALIRNPNIPGLHSQNGFELLEHVAEQGAKRHAHSQRHQMESPFWRTLTRAATNTNVPMSTLEDVVNLNREWATNNREVAYTLGQELRNLRHRDREAFELPYRRVVSLKPEVQTNFQQVIFQPHYKDPALGLREHVVYWFPSALVTSWLTLGTGVGMLHALGIPILHFGREQQAGAPGRERHQGGALRRAGEAHPQIHPFPLFLDERLVQLHEQLAQIPERLVQTGHQLRETIQSRQGLLTRVGFAGLIFVFGQNPLFLPFIASQIGRTIGNQNTDRVIAFLKELIKFLGKRP